MLLGEGTLTLSPTLEVLTFFFLSTIDDILSTSCFPPYDETHTLERSYENLVTDGILADTLKPIDNALIGVQETIQATKDITNGDITNGAIVIAGAIF
jgi:hypothetical protein